VKDIDRASLMRLSRVVARVARRTSNVARTFKIYSTVVELPVCDRKQTQRLPSLGFVAPEC
jgi:hypothetical protein